MKAVGNVIAVNYIVATSFSLRNCKNIVKPAISLIAFKDNAKYVETGGDILRQYEDNIICQLLIEYTGSRCKFQCFVTLYRKDSKSNSISAETNVHINKILPTRTTASNRAKYVIGPERVI